MRPDSDDEDFKRAFAATPKPPEPRFLRARVMHRVEAESTPRNPTRWMLVYAGLCIVALEYVTGMKGQTLVLAPIACLIHAARRPILRAFAPFLR